MHRKCSPLQRKLPHPGEAQGGEQPDPRHVKVLSNVIVWGLKLWMSLLKYACSLGSLSWEVFWLSWLCCVAFALENNLGWK